MLGNIFAVSCAITWSLSVILFKKTGDNLHPVLLNLLKNLFGLLLIIPTIYFVEGTLSLSLTDHDLIVLLISGFLGIGFADAMILKALKDIGASRMAIVECTYSPFVLLLSIAFLGESLSSTRLVGGALVVSALLLVSVPSAADGTPVEIRPKLSGFLWGIGGLLSMAAGIVMIKPLFATVPLFFVIGIRLGAGVVGSLVIFALVRDKRRHLADLRAAKQRGLIVSACVLSTYVSMMMWVAGYKYNDAGITAVLNQTSTIFTVLFASLFLRERMTPVKWTAAALASSGVMTMTLF